MATIAEIRQRYEQQKVTPPFVLTDEQRAQLDAVRTTDAKIMLLQIFHSTHCFPHRDFSIFGMVADPAVFTRWWSAREDEHMAEAWAAYLGPMVECAA